MSATKFNVRDAYGQRAAEYAAALGSIEHMHDEDRALIERWADTLGRGPVLDAGCGPGHWTALLHARGLAAEGIDLVPEFVDHARNAYPGVAFRAASIEHSGIVDGALGGVLAWYSLIHIEPDRLPSVLSEVSRIVAPGGGLLVGFFDGQSRVPFGHAITTAYFWSVEDMSALLVAAGFTVRSTEQRRDSGARPHAAIAATRDDAVSG